MTIVELISGFEQLMDKGGPIMWVLFVTCWLVLLIMVERTVRYYFWNKKALNDYLLLQKESCFVPNLHDNFTILGRILSKIDWHSVADKQDFSDQVTTTVKDLMPKLEGTLSTLAVLAGLLPMLGLLGTVTGMIQVFEVIAIQGSGDPKAMADGISQALLTTAAGLTMAIPVIFVHHILENRLRLIMSTVEQGLNVIFRRPVEFNRAVFGNNNLPVEIQKDMIHV